MKDNLQRILVRAPKRCDGGAHEDSDGGGASIEDIVESRLLWHGRIELRETLSSQVVFPRSGGCGPDSCYFTAILIQFYPTVMPSTSHRYQSHCEEFH